MDSIDDNKCINNGLSKGQQRSVYNVAIRCENQLAGSPEQKLALLKLAINKSSDTPIISDVIDATPSEIIRQNLTDLLAIVAAQKAQDPKNHRHIPDMDAVAEQLNNRISDAAMEYAHAIREPVLCECSISKALVDR